MGVDFYTCPVCQSTFPDCGEYERCGQCSEAFCSEECAKIECHCNQDKDDPHEHEECDECENCSCVLCRKDVLLDGELLKWLLKHDGMTRKQAEDEYRKQAKKGKGK